MDEQLRRILIIDDDRDSLESILEPLVQNKYDARSVTSGPESLRYIEKWQPHIVLIDSVDPNLGGLKILSRIREKLKYVSCIFLSRNKDPQAVISCLDAGADDYIVKPFNSSELLARVRTHIRIRDLQDKVMTVNEKLQELIEIDDLTGLFNMRSLYSKLDLEIERSRRFGRRICVIMVDMDHFKSVNDDHDHLFGSYVISEVGRLIKIATRNIDIPARYGGDEFLIVLTETHELGAMQFCERLQKTIQETTFKQGHDEMNLTISMGIALTNPGENITAREVVRRADHALYRAKEEGRNRICVHGQSPIEAMEMLLKRSS
ncbi:MAG: diguanylate cyclase [Pseudobdellovibrionaceae bacterium]